MKTEKMRVFSNGSGMEEALEMTEQLGKKSGLSKKQALHLRLLAEELLGMLRSIAGSVESDYWIVKNGSEFALHLQSDIPLNREMRKQFLAVSTSGENTAARGFMGKIRDMISVALMPQDADASLMSGLSMGMMNLASNSPSAVQASADAFRWSMQQYKDEMKKREGVETEEAWDELEKSIVASIADEVNVFVTGSRVEIIIDKAF